MANSTFPLWFPLLHSSCNLCLSYSWSTSCYHLTTAVVIKHWMDSAVEKVSLSSVWIVFVVVSFDVTLMWPCHHIALSWMINKYLPDSLVSYSYRENIYRNTLTVKVSWVNFWTNSKNVESNLKTFFSLEKNASSHNHTKWNISNRHSNVILNSAHHNSRD